MSYQLSASRYRPDSVCARLMRRCGASVGIGIGQFKSVSARFQPDCVLWHSLSMWTMVSALLFTTSLPCPRTRDPRQVSEVSDILVVAELKVPGTVSTPQYSCACKGPTSSARARRWCTRTTTAMGPRRGNAGAVLHTLRSRDLALQNYGNRHHGLSNRRTLILRHER
ncbi:hypothetical protein BXZ70DRAFT_106079 [Cristinia sonorae]|uniref:Uncharacterized protein n=1 Tax=Cristinia sonorae TaxID=1940300 RepID=A0A8K0USI6_9AGAR|nr:hypothetical protein BXZ70DRAFT_106079 [Cristinia sonorae]